MVSDVAIGKNGITTSDNDTFLRLWDEVSFNGIKFKRTKNSMQKTDKWIPYNKAGGKRRWYGNLDYVINWENNGSAIKNLRDEKGKKLASVRNESYYFKEALSWSDIKSNGTSFRYYPNGLIFDASANTAYVNNEKDMYSVLSIANSKVMDMFAEFYNPGIHFKIGNFYNVPYPISENDKVAFAEMARQNISISKQDWDSHETSWDFQGNELLTIDEQTYKENINNFVEQHYEETGERLDIDSSLPDTNSLAWRVEQYKQKWEHKFMQLHKNEEELNRRFIDIYGLQDELTPDVPLDEITILQQGEISIE